MAPKDKGLREGFVRGGPGEDLAKFASLLADKITGNRKGAAEIVEIRKHGEAIIIPADLSYDGAIEAIQRKQKADETYVTVSEVIACFPWDGAIALQEAFRDKFGMAETDGQIVPTFFGPMRVEAETKTVEVGPNKTMQVPWGMFYLPTSDADTREDTEDYLQCSQTDPKQGPVQFVIVGKVRRKYLPVVHDITTMVRRIVSERSIYKAGAIRVQFTDDANNLIPLPTPRFWDLNGPRLTPLIFQRELEKAVAVNVLTPLKYREHCARAGVPFKRGVLLTGRFGVGKTLLAAKVADIATANGVTFVYVTKVADIAHAYRFAKQYAPAVLFAEDIDSYMGYERDEAVNRVLNTIDGVDSKDAQIMTILTTNNIDGIGRALLRPGRTDVILNILPPDAEAVVRLVRAYAGKLLAHDSDLTPVGTLLDGQIAAVVREVVERAKLGVIERTGRMPLEGDLLPDDILTAGYTMKQQSELLDRDEEEPLSDMEKAATIFSDGLDGTLRDIFGRARAEGANGSEPEVHARRLLAERASEASALAGSAFGNQHLDSPAS